MQSNLKAQDFTLAPKISLADSKTGNYIQSLLRGHLHKLNNMLAVIQGFADLISDTKDNPDEREAIFHIKKTGSEAAIAGERLLAAAGCCRVSEQKIRLSSYLDIIKKDIAKPLLAKGIELDLRIADDLPILNADGSRLREILREIFANACNAKTKKILIQAEKEKISPQNSKLVDILIIIEGSEIKTENISEIFAPFSKKRASADNDGLGLAIAAAFSYAMSCKLGVRSDENSTSFWLAIPTEKSAV